jgi:hypothetical protein
LKKIKAQFVDDLLETTIISSTEKEIGEIVIATDDIYGIIYDCSVEKYDNEIAYIKKLRVNKYFYHLVQEEYDKYNKKVVLL